MRPSSRDLVSGLLLAGAAGFAALVGCGRGDATETVVVTGSSTVAPLVSEIARRFEEGCPDVQVDVQAGGSARGIADVRRGLADVGMVSRALGADEEDLVAYPVARDGVTLIVHRDNPVEELSREQVRAVWTGRIREWSEVGGRGGRITVVQKAEGRATREVFLRHFDLRGGAIRSDVVVGANQQAIRTVAGNPRAVGYVSIGEAEVEAERGVPIRLLPLGGVAGTTTNVATGRFPLHRVLSLVTATEPRGSTAAFLDFSRSPDVHDLIERRGFAPIAGE